jgi:hypothetical protein
MRTTAILLVWALGATGCLAGAVVGTNWLCRLCVGVGVCMMITALVLGSRFLYARPQRGFEVIQCEKRSR